MISPIERFVINAQPNRDAGAVKQFREIGLAHRLTGDMAPMASFPSSAGARPTIRPQSPSSFSAN
jgi:hypothetical protein